MGRGEARGCRAGEKTTTNGEEIIKSGGGGSGDHDGKPEKIISSSHVPSQQLRRERAATSCLYIQYGGKLVSILNKCLKHVFVFHLQPRFYTPRKSLEVFKRE